METHNPVNSDVSILSQYKLKRCSKKECCKQCRYDKFKKNNLFCVFFKSITWICWYRVGLTLAVKPTKSKLPKRSRQHFSRYYWIQLLYKMSFVVHLVFGLQYCFGKVFPVWNFPAFYCMHANCPNGDGNQSSFGRSRYNYVNYQTFARR